MSTITPILHTIGSKGSGTGHSFYSGFNSCPTNAALYNTDERNFLDEKSGMGLGTIGHAFLELHWKGKLKTAPTVAVEFSQLVDEENRVNAERCFTYFRQTLSEDDALGTIVGVEPLYPEDEQDAAILQGLFGVPFTFKPDLVTDLGVKQLARLRKKNVKWYGQLGILKPGRWLWDYKHFGRRESNLLDKALGSTQYASYIEAYNALHPKKPCLGMIQITIFTTKETEIWMTVIPPPTPALWGATQIVVRRGHRLSQVRPLEVVPTESNCFSYGGICRWLKEGLCDRSGVTHAGLNQLKKGGFV